MGKYGKGMRDCCDSLHEPSSKHIMGCMYYKPIDFRRTTLYWEAACQGGGQKGPKAPLSKAK